MLKIEEQIKIIRNNIVEIIPEDELFTKLESSIINNKPLKIKVGFDPTSSDIHLGHMILLQKLYEFQQLDHQIYLIIGNFTATIGDPTGKSKTRKIISENEILENIKTYQKQIFKILDPNKTNIVFNNDWLSKMNIKQLFELCSLQTVSRMLERDDFSKRFNNHQPISIHEFLYPLIQGYDSYILKSDIEIGGIDQKFNLLMGREIQKHYNQNPQVILMLPILEGLNGTQKMSKSLNNYIGIDESHDQIYGKIMSISDELMIQYYKLLTDLDIQNIKYKMDNNLINPMDVKKDLAFYLVKKCHNEELAKQAENNFMNIIQNKNIPNNIQEYIVDKNSKIWIINILINSNILESKNKAKQLIKQGGVYINNERVLDENLELLINEDLIIKIGKRRFLKIKIK